jgi:hypothetical protein
MLHFRRIVYIATLCLLGALLLHLRASPAFAADGQPPVIYNFAVDQSSEGSWTISGQVYDPDDNVEGMTVYFGGVLAKYGLTATVDANGNFFIAVEISDIQGGTATAQTYDWSLNPSNLAQCYVIAWD